MAVSEAAASAQDSHQIASRAVMRGGGGGSVGARGLAWLGAPLRLTAMPPGREVGPG
jgi:hypothetical protein